MSLKSKRLIAREFLILVGLISCVFVFWATLVGWNTWLEKDRDEASEQISQTKKDIQFITEKYYIEYDEFGVVEKSNTKWIPRSEEKVVDEDPILRRGNNIIDPLGILKKRKEPTNSAVDSLNILLSGLKRQEDEFVLKERQFRHSKSNLSSYTLIFTILVLILAYPIRFLILSVKWSIKTLKSPDKNEV